MYVRILLFLACGVALLAGTSQVSAHMDTAPQQTTTPAVVETDTSAAQPIPIYTNPVWMYMGSIGMSQPVIPAGLDINGSPIVPDHEVGWFMYSARPGQGENVVFWGHVLRFQSAPHIPAPFGRLKEANIGDYVSVFTEDGKEHLYQVTEKLWVQPHEVHHILPVGYERLTMVSCIGDWVIINGSVEDMSHRLITIAMPVE